MRQQLEVGLDVVRHRGAHFRREIEVVKQSERSLPASHARTRLFMNPIICHRLPFNRTRPWCTFCESATRRTSV